MSCSRRACQSPLRARLLSFSKILILLTKFAAPKEKGCGRYQCTNAWGRSTEALGVARSVFVISVLDILRYVEPRPSRAGVTIGRAKWRRLSADAFGAAYASAGFFSGGKSASVPDHWQDGFLADPQASGEVGKLIVRSVERELDQALRAGLIPVEVDLLSLPEGDRVLGRRRRGSALL